MNFIVPGFNRCLEIPSPNSGFAAVVGVITNNQLRLKSIAFV
jgi:hypothetical protein